METGTVSDNKIRLAPDVLAKAEEIAQTWGLKNSRAAIEAVFRKYADEYQYGRRAIEAETTCQNCGNNQTCFVQNTCAVWDPDCGASYWAPMSEGQIARSIKAPF